MSKLVPGQRLHQRCVCCCWNKLCNFNYCRIFIFLVVTSIAFIFFLAVYTCKPMGHSCFGLTDGSPVALSYYDAFLMGKVFKHNFSEAVLNKERRLNLEGEDVLIYLHIQKTGGATFGRHLVHNLDVDFPCECKAHIKKCVCVTRNSRRWLFSRHATGWMCGLHADWTELTDCVDKWFKRNDVKSRKHRVYHYITFLRDPVKRFLSEWQHVQRGATWKAARLHCNGRDATMEEVPFCFTGVDWSGVPFDEFMSCKHNLAFNRMTRMMANLSKVNCYNRTGLTDDVVNEILLKSAKENLEACAFFGLVEEQQKTQFLFEKTMGLKFIDNFRQKIKTHVSRLEITEEMTKKVVEKNILDIELYQYAKDLFLQRVAYMERKLGYTVDEYFNHIRDADDAGDDDTEEVDVDEYGDEDDTDDDIDDDGVDIYPGKNTTAGGEIPNSSTVRLNSSR
ncbi:unnamed protein product [Candidula unifasciata]|uniref:Heparan-sulfate 6-O-sulfotransferase n=1 Tax=Candidula unifasciata TaxID=100452 RepID=A0A8S3ZJI1_9EUPU|nr:unnamed protein product [Candidula unifasciata]